MQSMSPILVYRCNAVQLYFPFTTATLSIYIETYKATGILDKTLTDKIHTTVDWHWMFRVTVIEIDTT